MHALTLAVHFLTRCMSYDLPEQDLGFSLRRMPTRPRSGVLLRNIRASAALDCAAPVAPSSIAAREVAEFERGTAPPPY